MGGAYVIFFPQKVVIVFLLIRCSIHFGAYAKFQDTLRGLTPCRFMQMVSKHDILLNCMALCSLRK